MRTARLKKQTMINKISKMKDYSFTTDSQDMSLKVKRKLMAKLQMMVIIPIRTSKRKRKIPKKLKGRLQMTSFRLSKLWKKKSKMHTLSNT